MIAALLLARAMVGPVVSADDSSQTIFVTWDARTKACLPRINGVETGDVGTDDGKSALVNALPDKGRTLHIFGASEDAFIPFDCMRAIVKTLQRAGYYGRIAAISEPPPPKP